MNLPEDTERPGWEAYCPLLDTGNGGAMCDGVISCADCNVFWKAATEQQLDIKWLCAWCLSSEEWEALGYFAVGEGSLWSDDFSDVRCDCCGKPRLLLTAAVRSDS